MKSMFKNNRKSAFGKTALAACLLGAACLACNCQSVLKENAEQLSGTWLELDENGNTIERGLIFNLEGQAGTFNLEEEHFAPLTYDLSGDNVLTVQGYPVDDGGVVNESQVITKTCKVTTIDRENLSLACSELSKSYKRSIVSLLYDDSLLQVQAPEPDLRY